MAGVVDIGAFTEAATQVFARGDVWLIVIAAALYGVFVGAIPGLTATMAVALFVPMAYWLDPIAAIAAIITMAACAIFAGDLPTVLLRIPGTPASAAYVDDAYAFTRRGEAQRVLRLGLVCSVIGGIFGAIAMMMLGGWLAQAAGWFSVTEYFWLFLIGLTCAVVVAEGPRSKAVLSLLLGLFFSTIGLSAAHQEPRFTLGIASLYSGISFIPAMIGLFGMSEVLLNLVGGAAPAKPRPPVESAFQRSTHSLALTLQEIGDRLRRRKMSTLRSGGIGVLIGMLPGAGCDIASWVAFAASRRMQQKAQAVTGDEGEVESQRRSLDSIGDATTANNASLAGSWIPALVFGIPGDSITAIVIGVLMMKNLTPGPQIFDEQLPLVYSIYLLFILANLVLLPVGLLAIRVSGTIVQIPKAVLFPLIVAFCVTGSYALNGSLFDVLTMLAMGILGFVLVRLQMPPAPVVLGIILGGPLEERLVQSLTAANGNIAGLVQRPLSIALATLFVVLVGSMLVESFRRRERQAT